MSEEWPAARSDRAAAFGSGDASEPGKPGIHAGRDGLLFLTQGSNRVLEQYGTPGFPRAALWAWRRLIAYRVRRCAGLGARYLHAVAPEKLTIHCDAAEGLPLDPARAPALRLARWLRLSRARHGWIDLVGPLREARGRVPLYLKTDSHWTFEGGLIAYQAICRAMGVSSRADIGARRIAERFSYSGDLGVQCDPVAVEIAQGARFESAARRIYANAFLLHFESLGRPEDAHIGAHAVFSNDDPKADPRKLVIFGDSYAQHRGMNPVATLTPLLADTFREVHFLWSTSVDWHYLEKVRPDFVLGEIAERFMVEVPPRGFRIERLAELAMARKEITEQGAVLTAP